MQRKYLVSHCFFTSAARPCMRVCHLNMCVRVRVCLCVCVHIGAIYFVDGLSIVFDFGPPILFLNLMLNIRNSKAFKNVCVCFAAEKAFCCSHSVRCIVANIELGQYDQIVLCSFWPNGSYEKSIC